MMKVTGVVNYTKHVVEYGAHWSKYVHYAGETIKKNIVHLDDIFWKGELYQRGHIGFNHALTQVRRAQLLIDFFFSWKNRQSQHSCLSGRSASDNLYPSNSRYEYNSTLF